MTEREAREYVEQYVESEPYSPLARAIKVVLREEDARTRAERREKQK